MSHAWSTQMGNLARDLGVHGYEDGTLWFRQQSGVEVVVEPLLDGESLAVHARLGRVGWQDGGPSLDALLRANAPSKTRFIVAIDAVDEDVVLFRRFDDADVPYASFVDGVQQFAQAAAEGSTRPLTWQENDLSGDALLPVHADASSAMRNAIAAFAHARGLEPPEDTSQFLVCMPGGGGISLQIDPATGELLLVSHLGPVPTEDQALRQLLELHMLGEVTGGAYFAIDAQRDDLILHRSVSADGLDGLELDRLLNTMGAATLDCAGRLGLSLPRFD
ncbi:type III secretion system chaperone [Hydrogenophaga sp. BPS33]|uniref:type III secretion system chaperone n=1 Tax=Hydrogenophaga sp. BPS33 TaxID=2651974 RepID=UPI00131F4F8C|nr:type III secretion system chaperone [Hydrogenophaga sp. BPS33]QHE85790.1 type III secretion system chaperone [Hydrogenophaga sp. BPS33]